MKSRVSRATGRRVDYFDLPELTEEIPFDKIQVEGTVNYPFRGKIKSDKDVEAYRKEKAAPKATKKAVKK